MYTCTSLKIIFRYIFKQSYKIMVAIFICRLKPSHQHKHAQLYRRLKTGRERSKLCYQGEVVEDSFRSKVRSYSKTKHSNNTEGSCASSARLLPGKAFDRDSSFNMYCSYRFKEAQKTANTEDGQKKDAQNNLLRNIRHILLHNQTIPSSAICSQLSGSLGTQVHPSIEEIWSENI